MFEWIILPIIGLISLIVFLFLARKEGFFKKNLVTHPNSQKNTYCALNFQNAINALLILGESNHFFWEEDIIKDALEKFMDNKQSSMLVILGPEYDLASESFLYTLAKGLLLKKIQVRIARTRNVHHIKYFELQNNQKIVISELPHERLQNEREDFLVCTNRNDCSILMKKYLDNAISNSDEATYDTLFNNLKFIKWDDKMKKAYPVSRNDIDSVINKLKTRLQDFTSQKDSTILNDVFTQEKKYVPT